MPTLVLKMRNQETTQESVPRGFAVALVGHLLVAGAIAGATWLSHRLNPTWGETDPTVGSVQVSAVDALPLPPKQLVSDRNVLTSEKPSVAPLPPPPSPTPPVPKAAPIKPKTEVAPKPDAIPIPTKTTPVKAPVKAEREVPVAPERRPPPPPQPTPKAPTGDTPGVPIPQSLVQLKNGTASITIQDRVFGDRYAFYMRLIAQKIRESKAQDIDPPDAKGKHTLLHFTIERDGAPTDVGIDSRSGSPALDTSTVRSIQRIDTFGPLPTGNQLVVTVDFYSH